MARSGPGRGQVAEVDAPAAGRALADGLGHGVGLLVDLLEHERLVALLLRRVGVPVDLDDLVLDRLAGRGVELGALGAQHDELVVADVLHPAGLAQEGRDRGGDERLAVTAADDQRALLARADQHARLAGGEGDERVVAAQLGVGGAHGLEQVAVVVVGDEVGDHLGVGLGGEHGGRGASSIRRAFSAM